MKRLSIILILVIWYNVLAGKDNPAPYSRIEKNDRIGLADIHGNVIIPPDYENLGWSGGSLEVIRDRIGYRENGMWGILNLENKKITPPQFLSLYPGDNDQLIASIPDQYKLAEIFGIISIEGKPVSGFYFNSLTGAGKNFIGGIRKSEIIRYGVISSGGAVTIPVKYEMISYLGNNLFACTIEPDRFMLINSAGNTLSNELFDEIIPFKSGYAGISSRGKHGLINETGKIILKPEYKDIDIQDPENIRYMNFSEWNILDGTEPLSKLSYDSIMHISADRLIAISGYNLNIINLQDSIMDSYAGLKIVKIHHDALVVREKHKQGLLGTDGDMIYPLIYDSIIYLQDYVLLYIKKDSEAGWMMGDRNGEILNSGLYESLVALNGGNIMAKRKGFWGILNNQGGEKINCIYDTLIYHDNGLIKVVFHSANGLLWKNRWFIHPGPMQINILKDEQILVTDYNGSIILNILGDTLYRTEYVIIPLGNFYKTKSREGKFGLLDQGFNIILYPVSDHLNYFARDSLFVFKSETGWGAINIRGKILFDRLADIDSVLSFSEGYFRVMIDNNYGFIDMNGKLRIANRYTEAMDFIDDIAPVKIMDRWGFISKYETFLIQPFYDVIFNRHKGLIVVRRDSEYGIINNNGDIVQDFDYQAIIPANSAGFLCRKNGLIGYIDEQGLLTVIPRYDHIEDLANGNLIVSRNNKFGMLSGSGDTILPVIYDALYEEPVSRHMIALVRSKWKALK